MTPNFPTPWPESRIGRIDIWQAGHNLLGPAPNGVHRPVWGARVRKKQATISGYFAALPSPDSPEVIAMSTGPQLFKSSELIRAVKSVQATGLDIRNVEIDRSGVIRVNIGKAGEAGKNLSDEQA
jgi:hypothetical protein